MTKTIEIDCAPGMTRPDAYIADVMKDTAVEYDGREPVSRCFGNWMWDFTDISDEAWTASKSTFATRLTELYNLGAIRYASW